MPLARRDRGSVTRRGLLVAALLMLVGVLPPCRWFIALKVLWHSLIRWHRAVPWYRVQPWRNNRAGRARPPRLS